MIRHTKQFRLFADIKMIAEILCIILIAHFVDPCRQKLACTVGGYLVQYIYAAVCKKFSRCTDRVKHKRKVIELEGFLIIIAITEIFNVISKLCEKNKVIGNKGEEYLTVIFADTLCFADTFLFIRIIFQMIKRAEQKDNIK